MKRLVSALLIAVAVFVCTVPTLAQATRTPITVITTPNGGIVFLDGQRLGPAPIHDWAVLPGVHRLSVRVNGMVAYSKEITIRSGAGQRFDINLTPPPPKH